MLRLPPIGAALVLAMFAAAAHADPVADLDAVFEPIRELHGPDLVVRACADNAKLVAAAARLPKTPPKGSVADAEIWKTAVSNVQLELDGITRACKAPAFTYHDTITNIDETADAQWPTIAENLVLLLEYAKPRTFPPVFTRFHATLDRVHQASRPALICARAKDASKQLETVGHSIPNPDPDRWQNAADDLASSLKQLERFTCGAHHGADDEIADTQQMVHDRYYVLALVIPPNH
jgi:hypothetical protein